MPVIDRLPAPEPPRQVPSRAARAGAEEDPVDHHPVIGPPATARQIGRQQPRRRSRSSSDRSWRFSRSGTVMIYTSRARRSTGHALVTPAASAARRLNRYTAGFGSGSAPGLPMSLREKPTVSQTAPLRLTTSSFPCAVQAATGRNAVTRVHLPNSPRHHAGTSAAGPAAVQNWTI
jgi:hypothetical protein